MYTIIEGKKLKAQEMRQDEFVYVAGKIIEKIGPILAINNKEFINDHVVKNLIKKSPEKLENLSDKGISNR